MPPAPPPAAAAATVIATDEPPAFQLVNPHGRSSALLLCDHAAARVPRSLGSLGLRPELLLEHIGWDIGAALLSRRLSALLDAPLVLSGYSRLVIDCNRPLGEPTSIPPVSGGVTIPGNSAVAGDPAEAEARAQACFWPYHNAVAQLLDQRLSRGQATSILSIHSFTPSLLGDVRPWHAAMLYGRDRRLAASFLDALRLDPALCIGDNEPYHVTDEGDYSIPVHGEARGLRNVLIEVRQDGLASAGAIEVWATRLATIYGKIEAPL